MPDIKVNVDELRTTAKNIDKKNNDMKTKLQEIQSVIKNLRSNNQFVSEASNEFCSKIDALAPKFDEYHAAINNYRIYLEKAASEYEAVDKAGVAAAAGQR